eukprot:TRINITY_DN7698_c0_g1_i1.p1 TRINITY_DN7698_c0_g1~~TRINITY_DN7698_c0_g1_i1.p1  ORF type:complete len:86 (+),score=17.85 TRINITY_DN7698_c0_g1_i1:438-695(+)
MISSENENIMQSIILDNIFEEKEDANLLNPPFIIPEFKIQEIDLMGKNVTQNEIISSMIAKWRRLRRKHIQSINRAKDSIVAKIE